MAVLTAQTMPPHPPPEGRDRILGQVPTPKDRRQIRNTQLGPFEGDVGSLFSDADGKAANQALIGFGIRREEDLQASFSELGYALPGYEGIGVYGADHYPLQACT
jgi:hypothetical protein